MPSKRRTDEIGEMMDAAFEGRAGTGDEAGAARGGRGKSGRFEEERVGPRADLDNILGFMDEEERKRDAENAGIQAKRDARHSGLQPEILVPMSQRAGVSFTLTLASIESLGRLALVRGLKRGQLLDELIAAAAKAEFGVKEGGKKR